MTVEPFVRCSNMAESLRFYTQVLDFEIRVSPDPDPTAFMSKYALLERAGSLLHLSAHEGDGVFGNQVYVRVSDIDPIYQRVAAAVGELSPVLRLQPTQQTWGMTELAVVDPDGNKVTYGQTSD